MAEAPTDQATLSFADVLALLGHTDHTPVCWKPSGGVFHARVVPSGEAPALAASLAEKGDVWFGVNETNGPARGGRADEHEVSRLCCVFADVDVKPGGCADLAHAQRVVDEIAALIEEPPTYVTSSGSGLQPVWAVDPAFPGALLDTPESRARAKRLMARFKTLTGRAARAHGTQLDNVFDLARILRVPATMNYKTAPAKPVGCEPGGGSPISVEYLEAVLDAYDIPEPDQPQRGAGTTAPLSPADWPKPEHTCPYAKAMIAGWSVDCASGGRHQWLTAQAVRLAAAARNGCIAQRDMPDAGLALKEAAARICATQGDPRELAPKEVQDALAWAVRDVSAKTAEQVRAELGEHEHQEPGGWIPRQTDKANAELLIAEHGHLLRYDPTRVAWLEWDGARWAYQPDDAPCFQAAAAVAEALPDAAKEEREHKRKSLSLRGLESVVRVARRDKRLRCDPESLDADPMSLNTPGGIVSLVDGSIRAHDPGELHTKLTGCAPDFDTRAPVWEGFLAQILADDNELTVYLQRLVGLAATGLATTELPFLHGVGANGKSVLVDVLLRVLGDYATTAPRGFLLEGRDKHEAEVARLKGMRLVVCSEVKADSKFDEEKVKLLTGGDKLTARHLYGHHFTFAPAHSIWLMGNHQPKVPSGGLSFWRRLRMVPFTVTIPEEQQVKDLAKTIVDTEGPGVLAWIVRGAVDALAHGVATPERVTAATAEYAREEDSVARFLEERCLISSAQIKTRTSLVVKEYAAWCREQGEDELEARAFGRELTRFGITRARSHGEKFYQGLALLAQGDEQGDRRRWND